jgi:hypothetical protein
MTYYRIRGLAACLLLFPFVISLGCDRPPALHPDIPEEELMRRPVFDVDDRSSEPAELPLMKKVFAPGCEPSDADLPKFTAYRYAAKSFAPSGDTATVTVALTNAKTKAPAGEIQWSLVRVKGIWRIKEAPLPGP